MAANTNDQKNQAFVFFSYKIFFNVAFVSIVIRSLNITISR